MTTRIHVLHVDDDSGFSELVADCLERESEQIDVVSAATATDGLQRLDDDETDIDCLVSDYDMPGMDGLELLDAIRDRYPDLPFILYTGKGSEEVASEAISKGATGYLQKRGGVEQYELLANRVENAVEQYRSRRRAEEHERITRVVRDINRALVYADSVAEIEREVCAVLSDADPYVTACIAGVDSETMRIEPRTWAGDAAGYFEELDMRVDEGTPGRHAPGGRAYHEREIAVSQNLSDDPQYEQWRDAATERSFRSLAAVPLEHEGDLYGILVVFADRPSAFDDSELDLLAELGDDTAHAMHARTVQAELRTTVSRLEALFERSPDMINVHDNEGNIITPNPRLCEQTGHDEDDLTGMKVWDLDRTIDPDETREIWENMAVGDSQRLEGEYRRADGSSFPVEVHVRRLDIEGEDRFIATSRDISERKRRERGLRRAERRYRAILQDPNILAGILDTDGTLLEQNRTATEYIEADPQDVEGTLFWETPWWPAEMRPVMRENIERAAAGEYVEYEADLSKPDGEPYSVEGVVRPVTDDDGAVVSLIVSARDVTERVAREKRLGAILENTSEPLFLKNRDGEYLVVNEGWKELFGHEKADVYGRTDADLFPAEMVEEVRKNDQHVLETGEPIEFEERIVVDGEERTFLSSKTPVYDIGTDSDPDDPVAVFGVAHDITERIQHERRLERQNERFDELAGAVSHDLQTPLETARGRAQLAIETGDTEQMRKALDAIERTDELRENLVNVLRTKEIVGQTEQVDTGRVARDAWDALTTPDGASLHVQETPVVDADPAALRRLFDNLLSNTVEHGGGELTVRVGETPDGFFVADNGPGIPPENRDAVFTPGYTTKSGGSGVGLSSVRQIVTAHGWAISITESESGGARFEIE